EKVKLAWISNTADLEWLAVSPALAATVQRRADIQVIAGSFDLPFDSQQNLPKFRDLRQSMI
ncbi:MAG: hypothetical protein JSW39_26795, partial [Desulfobacterales bacterium]